ncbi:MAG: hypothetical protein D6784_09525, partial [Chloroflexi bacterium]
MNRSGKWFAQHKVIISGLAGLGAVAGIILLVLYLTLAGDAARSEDIVPLEAQAVEPAAALALPEPTQQVKPTPTRLPAEIVEPVSPVSPVSPVPVQSEAKMTTPPTDANIPPESREPLAAAIADLAERLGLSPDEIQIVSIEAEQWPDTSLGCPREGYMYAQVITPGFRIVLEAG